MIGAILGDIVGSAFEFSPIKTKDFPLFSPHSDYTDDSLMTLAVGMALENAQRTQKELDTDFLQAQFMRSMQMIGRRYPHPTGGYGASFFQWLQSANPTPYNSWGNGAAMRVSPCGDFADSLEQALFFARQSALVSHNHPEGIKGAQATAAAVYLAKIGKSKAAIREYVQNTFYTFIPSIEEIRPSYRFDPSCQGTVPQALAAFFEATDFEDALRNAVSLGGDSDTLGAITGAVAWSYYIRSSDARKSMRSLAQHALSLLPAEFIPFLKRREML
uniref:ADP-ribosylglycohydrolase family protein n=1 Tax=Ndongobacter massiliensis TaxID=1871025 RepID=UPI00093152A5|nr:ADP-ribosylglycohydrolase family protein [Ndongobacter massiliensis]